MKATLYYGGNPNMIGLHGTRSWMTFDFDEAFGHLDGDEEPFDLDSIQTHWLHDFGRYLIQHIRLNLHDSKILGDFSTDDHALNLTASFVDLHDLCTAHESSNWIFLRVSISSVHLYCIG